MTANVGLYRSPPALKVGRVSDAVQELYSTPAVSTVQTGHGWTGTNNASGDLNYTGDFAQGSQCIKIVTTGAGAASASTVRSPRMTAIDLTGKMLRFRVKVLDAASMGDLALLTLYVGGGASAFSWYGNQAVLVGTDDATLGGFIKAGEWCDVTINPIDLGTRSGTLDWTAVRDLQIRVQDTAGGAGNEATVLFGGWSIVANEAAYPHGVISLTFDDGYTSSHSVARAKMDGYGYPGTAFVIHDRIGTNNGYYLTAAELDELVTSGWDIALHADKDANHSLTNGLASMASSDAVWHELMDNQTWLRSLGALGIYDLAWPRGGYTMELTSFLTPYLASARTVSYRTMEKLPVVDPMRLRTNLLYMDKAVTPNTTVSTLEWYVDQTYTHGGWLILTFHKILASPVSGSDFASASFDTLIDYIATKGVPVETMREVMTG